MDGTATFTIYGSLQDFLPPAKRAGPLPYSFAGAPAVKDAIEATGVPHPEVAVILVNSQSVGFYHALQAGDEVAVYPAAWEALFPADYSVRFGHDLPDRFVLDVHLGKLVKALRLLGFDSCYRNDYSDKAIAAIAEAENRIALTRDVGLLKQKAIRWGYWLRSQHLEAQLEEVMSYFHLKEKLRPFTRCMECNGLIAAVPKESVLGQLPLKTKEYFDEFYQCTSCSRVYWKGSHYERMQAFVQRQLRR